MGTESSQQRSAATQRAKTRDSILEAGAAVFADAAGHPSTARIAEAAGISEVTLYRHFATREVLVGNLFAAIVFRPSAAVIVDGGEPLAELRRYISMVMRLASQHRRLSVEMMQHVSEAGAARGSGRTASDPRTIAPLPAPAAALLEQAMARGELHDDVAVADIASMLINTTLVMLLARPEQSLDDAMTLLERTLLRGVERAASG